MNEQIHTLSNVTVKKGDLLKVIRENKEDHDKLLAEAMDGYYKSLEKELEEKIELASELKKDLKDQLDLAKSKKELKRLEIRDFRLESCKPEDHSEDYLNTIRKIELSVADTITLNDKEFSQYVSNNWAWKDSFVLTASAYLDGGTSNATVGTFLKRK